MKITIVGSGINERRIATVYDHEMGRWEAVVAGDYHDPERDPTGFGSSEENAIADLIAQLEERE